MNLEDTLQAALHHDDRVDPQRSALALAAATEAAMRSRRRGRLRRITTATLPVTLIGGAGIGLWAILPGGDPPSAAPATTVPNLQGLREDEAWARLRDLGLTADVISVDRGLSKAGLVLAQRPAAGDPLPEPRGSVRIVVAAASIKIDTKGAPVTRPLFAGMGCVPATCDVLRVAAWPRLGAIRRMTATIDGRAIGMRRVADTTYWQGSLPQSGVAARILAARGTFDGWSGGGPTIVVDARLVVRLENGTVRRWRQPLVVGPGWG